MIRATKAAAAAAAQAAAVEAGLHSVIDFAAASMRGRFPEFRGKKCLKIRETAIFRELG